MSVEMTARYLGGKKVEMVHEQSGSSLITEAPRDNGGEGNSFSPTDLVGAAFASCVLTTIAIVAERNGISVDGMHARVEKHMHTDPRRIGNLPLMVHLPSRLSETERSRVEAAGRACPVKKTLHPDVQAEITYVYDVS